MHRTTHHRPNRRRRLQAAGTAGALAIAATTLAVVAAAPPASALVTTIAITSRVGTATGGGQAATGSGFETVVDATGRYVFFETASPLVAGDTNAKKDVYRKDRLTGTTSRVSYLGASTQSTLDASVDCTSTNGRFVGFALSGPGSPSATNGQLFVRDLKEATTDLVSQDEGAFANQGFETNSCGISDDGTRVVFASPSTNLDGGNPGTVDVFLRRRDIGQTQLISRNTAGTAADGDSGQATISANGGVVAFTSEATNLGGLDTDGDFDVFVRILATNTTSRVSTDGTGAVVEGASQSPSISAEGRYVAFSSKADDLVDGDSNGVSDIFRKDRTTGDVVRASVNTSGTQGDGASILPDLSSDGRWVAFQSKASNLYAADVNGVEDAFRHDLQLARTDLASRRSGSIAPGNDASWYSPSISDDGQVVGFSSYATDLVGGDTNGQWDAFVRDFSLELAPFGSAKAFAAQQLADFAAPNAAPSPAAVDAAAAEITVGAVSPDGLIVRQARATAWSAKRGPLVRLYWAFFLRAPDLGGMTYWTGQLAGGKTLAQVAAKFATSSEFQTKYGSLSNSAFVTKIYQNIFERNPDPGGLAYWTNKLATQQKTRGDVMVNFSESSEGKRVLGPQADTVLITLGMVGTMPTKATLLDQKAKREAGHAAEEYAATVRALPAYAARINP